MLGSNFIGIIQRRISDEAYPPVVQGQLPPEDEIIVLIVLANSLDMANEYMSRIVHDLLGGSTRSHCTLAAYMWLHYTALYVTLHVVATIPPSEGTGPPVSHTLSARPGLITAIQPCPRDHTPINSGTCSQRNYWPGTRDYISIDSGTRSAQLGCSYSSITA